ncbi:MAG: hypothetical protein WBH47_05190 [Streptosporangiaceae bacterium]
MVIAIVAAAAGILIALACVEIPRLVARRSDPYNDADALAYESKTGRSAQQIEQDNSAQQQSGSDG